MHDTAWDGDPERLGTLRVDGGEWSLRFERRLPHPPDKVWRAITESAHLEHWLPADIVGERRAGASIRLPFWPQHQERYGSELPVLDGRILVWDPPSVFEWTWDVDRLRFELEPAAGGTLLRFTTWLHDPGTPNEGTAAGYHVCFDLLEAELDGVPRTLPPDAEIEVLERRYAAQLGG